MDELASILLSMSDNQIDASMKPLIKKWSNPPKAIELLEVIDHCIHGSLASGFVVAALQAFYQTTCEQEQTSHEEVVKKATWRNELSK